MTHFAVLVIGPDVEQQLAPYHEFECTGLDDQFVVDVDITAEVLADGLADHGLDDRVVANESDVDRTGIHKYGYAIVVDGAVTKAVNRTNPNRKWDWYQVGGRWTGALKLKALAGGIVGRPGLMTEPAPAGYADQVMRRDVDFEQMRTDAEVKARALWKMTRELTGGQSWETWDDTMVRYPDTDRARAEYWEQPAIALLKASGKDAFRWQIDDDLSLDSDIFIQKARDSACVRFAFVRDGIWTERGRMGWFACVSDEVSPAQWNRMFNDMLDGFPDDTLLTVVDCHI